MTVHVDARGQLWAGTKSRGLDRLRTLDEPSGRGQWQHFSRADGLPDETIWGIESDAQGRLWLSTNRGLSRFDPGKESFVNYDVGHGLQSMEFNQGAHFSSPSGELFFGGINGFNAFFPDRIVSNAHVPPVILSGLTRFNQPMAFDQPGGAQRSTGHHGQQTSRACVISWSRVATSSTASWVADSTTGGATPASKACIQRAAHRHQRSPGSRPGKPGWGLHPRETIAKR